MKSQPLATSATEAELNEVKDALNIPDFLTLKKNDPWEKGIYFQRNRISVNYGGQNVTKAWLKMFEMLTQTSVGSYLIQLGDPLNCFFNAELPGGFIFAVNHFLRTNNKSFDWVISSYLPRRNDELFNDSPLEDDFNLLSKYPDHSLVGQIETNNGVFWSDGDLTNPKTPTILASLARSVLSPIHLYTADGGFDVQGRENQQEILSLPLIKGEIECGLRALSQGGIMIIKIFTFFTSQMLSMLAYLMRVFDSYDIYKPSTSGPLNSESYFMGIRYHGIFNLQDFNSAMPTNFEYNYLINKRNLLVTNQINNIRGFMNRNGPKLDFNLYQYVQKLPLEFQL